MSRKLTDCAKVCSILQNCAELQLTKSETKFWRLIAQTLTFETKTYNQLLNGKLTHVTLHFFCECTIHRCLHYTESEQFKLNPRHQLITWIIQLWMTHISQSWIICVNICRCRLHTQLRMPSLNIGQHVMLHVWWYLSLGF